MTGVQTCALPICELGDGELPCSVTVFIEGEEEIGSPSFEAFLRTHRERLESDVIVVADSSNWKVGVPDYEIGRASCRERV